MPIRLLRCRHDPINYAWGWCHPPFLLNTFKHFGSIRNLNPPTEGIRVTHRSEARGQSASDRRPATFASSVQRPEHQSPEPSTLDKHMGCGMVRPDDIDGTQLYLTLHPKLARRLAHHGPHVDRPASLGKQASMRVGAIVQQDCDRVAGGQTRGPCEHRGTGMDARHTRAGYTHDVADRKRPEALIQQGPGMPGSHRQLHRRSDHRHTAKPT